MDPQATTPKAPTKIDGHQLKAWREGMGYSQRDACKLLGCSRTAWLDWETGRHKVPRYIGYALSALATGMTVYGDEATVIDQKSA
jgi:transcriptional regulator with XRE-family HTH domain